MKIREREVREERASGAPEVVDREREGSGKLVRWAQALSEAGMGRFVGRGWVGGGCG